MNNSNSKSLDLNTMLQRLSFLAKVPELKGDDDIEDFDDSEDEDDEDDEEENNFIIDNQFKKTLNLKNEIVYETNENQDDDESNKTLKNNILSIENKKIFKKEKTELNNDLIEISNYNQNLPPFQNFAPISIKTDFTCSVDNQKSPRSQLYELALELEREKEEKNNLATELVELKNYIKDNYEVEINKLKLENQSLKEELNYCQRVVKDLKEASQLNNDRFSQIDSLRYDNKKLKDRVEMLTANNSQLKTQIEKIQKYESLFRGFDFIQVNQKLYQVINKIGSGGFSQVDLCVAVKEKKSFAVKRVNLKDFDSENIKLVMNEIDLLKKLEKNNKVVHLFDHEHVVKDNMLYMVMEVGSTDLNAFFKQQILKHKCVQEPARSYFWTKMLEAVLAIHKEGIIHSDIKPANFLVVGCEVKLIDFNISNTISDRTSITLTTDCGTLHYMAPESILKDNVKTKINQKTDVWSLGVILYLMTYGRLPFSHIKTQYQLIFAIGDPQKQISYPPINDNDLSDTLKKCLVHDYNQRLSVEQLLNHQYITNKFKTENKKLDSELLKL